MTVGPRRLRLASRFLFPSDLTKLESGKRFLGTHTYRAFPARQCGRSLMEVMPSDLLSQMRLTRCLSRQRDAVRYSRSSAIDERADIELELRLDELPRCRLDAPSSFEIPNESKLNSRHLIVQSSQW